MARMRFKPKRQEKYTASTVLTSVNDCGRDVCEAVGERRALQSDCEQRCRPSEKHIAHAGCSTTAQRAHTMCREQRRRKHSMAFFALHAPVYSELALIELLMMDSAVTSLLKETWKPPTASENARLDCGTRTRTTAPNSRPSTFRTGPIVSSDVAVNQGDSQASCVRPCKVHCHARHNAGQLRATCTEGGNNGTDRRCSRPPRTTHTPRHLKHTGTPQPPLHTGNQTTPVTETLASSTANVSKYDSKSV